MIRCVEFKQKYLNKIKTYYDIPNKIKILEGSKNVTVVTDVTLPRRVKEGNTESTDSQNVDSPAVNEPKIVQNTSLNNQCTAIKELNAPAKIVTSVTSVTEDDVGELT